MLIAFDTLLYGNSDCYYNLVKSWYCDRGWGFAVILVLQATASANAARVWFLESRNLDVETIIKVMDFFDTLGEISMQIHYASWSNFTFVFVLHVSQFWNACSTPIVLSLHSIEHSPTCFQTQPTYV